MSKKTHTHKYYKAKFSTGTKVFRCGFEGCTHFIMEPLVINRFSVCWRCGDIFVVVPKLARAVKMHCERCTRGRYNKIVEKTQVIVESEELIDQFMGDINNIIDLQNKGILKEGEMSNIKEIREGEGESNDTES